jgi:hypothetical protein
VKALITYSKIILTLIFVALLIGCNQSTTENDFSTDIVLTETPKTISPTKNSDVTPEPTQPPQPSFTPFIKSTATINAISTLSTTEAEIYLLNLFNENQECDLPCWWGIQPGVSTWHELQEVIMPIGYFQDISSVVEKGHYETGLSVGLGRDVSLSNLHIDFIGQGQIIEKAYIFTENSYPVTSPLYSVEYKDALSGFSLQAILNDYGEPSRILLGLSNGPIEPTGGWHYEILVFYDQLGFMLYYVFNQGISLNQSGNELSVCPNYEGTIIIRFALQSPSNTEPIEFVMERHIGVDPNYIRPLEDTTDITTLEFYESFKESGIGSCFQSGSENWY